MSGATRDPRIDPKPGDVIAGFRCEVVSVEDGCVRFKELNPDGGLIQWDVLPIDYWQLLNRKAEVIHVAD